MNTHKTEQDTTAYPQQDSEPESIDDTPGLCFTQLLRDKPIDEQERAFRAKAGWPLPSLPSASSDEPLCLTLLFQEAEQSPEGAENLRLYLQSRSGPAAAE